MRKLVLLLLMLIGASVSAVAREPIDTGAVRAALAQAYNLPEGSSWETLLLAPAHAILTERLGLEKPLTWPDLEKRLNHERGESLNSLHSTTSLEERLLRLVEQRLADASGSIAKSRHQLVEDFLRKERTKQLSEHITVLMHFLDNLWAGVFAEIQPTRELCARPARCT